MDPKDVRLLEDESKEFLLKTKRSQQHATAVPFMRRTEYIAAEFNRFGTGADRYFIFSCSHFNLVFKTRN